MRSSVSFAKASISKNVVSENGKEISLHSYMKYDSCACTLLLCSFSMQSISNRAQPFKFIIRIKPNMALKYFLKMGWIPISRAVKPLTMSSTYSLSL